LKEIAAIKKVLDPDSDPVEDWSKLGFHSSIDSILAQFWKDTTSFSHLQPSKTFDADSRAQLYQGTPILLQRGASPMSQWPAMEKWKPSSLLTHYGNHVFECGGSGGESVMLETLLEYNLSQQDDTPLYIFDEAFRATCPEMLKDYNQNIDAMFPEDLMQHMPERPPHRWLLMGSRGTGTDVHQDPAGTVAWNMVVSGSKLWALLDPSLTKEDVMANMVPDDQPSLVWFRDHLKNIMLRFPGKVHLVVQEAGQCMLLPANWWHAVFNLTNVIGMTDNHVSVASFCQELASVGADKAPPSMEVEKEEEKEEKKEREKWEKWEHELVNVIHHHFGLIDYETSLAWWRELVEKYDIPFMRRDVRGVDEQRTTPHKI
jgi:hypothetical protein